MKRPFWDLTLTEVVVIVLLALVLTWITMPNVTLLRPDKSTDNVIGPR